MDDARARNAAARALQEPLLDTLKVFEIPEGVSLEFRLAGPVVRACAWGIDAAIRGGVYLGLMLVLPLLGGVGTALMLIGLFLIEWFYPVVFELHNGATPGKRAMGIRVIQDNGTPVTSASSILRNLLRAVDFLPLFYALGLVSMLLDRQFRRLGDLAAGTLVVYRERELLPVSVWHAAPRKPPLELTREEQTVILTFAERAPQLSAARRVELAEMLSGLTGRSGQAAVDELSAYAHWIGKGHAGESGANGTRVPPYGRS